MENWRTDAEMKHHMIVKLFAVKFVVFYYPFAYTILIGPHQRYGCLDLTSPVQGGLEAFQRASGPEGGKSLGKVAESPKPRFQLFVPLPTQLLPVA